MLAPARIQGRIGVVVQLVTSRSEPPLIEPGGSGWHERQYFDAVRVHDGARRSVGSMTMESFVLAGTSSKHRRLSWTRRTQLK
jgi:hypothetical protein